MSDGTKNLLEALFAGTQLIAIAVGAVWAYLRFYREGQHSPRMEFELNCEFSAAQQGVRVAAFSIYAHNKGNVEHRFSHITLRALGLTSEDAPTLRADHRLDYPHLITKAEVIPSKFGYYFVRPGVNQRLSFTTTIPASMRFVLVRAAFQYQGSGDLHTAERAFDLSGIV